MLAPRLAKMNPRRRGAMGGLFLGVVALLGMFVPVNIVPGITIDGRVVVVAVAAAVGGPLAALTAPVLPLAYRLYLGGVGSFAGTGALIGGAIVGVLFFLRSKNEAQAWSVQYRLLLGVVVAVQALAWTFALPMTIVAEALTLYAVPVLIMYPLGCTLLATLIAQQDQRHAAAARLGLEIERQQRTEVSLRQSESRFRALAENIQEVFWISNPSRSQFLYVSPAYQQVWGRSVDDLYRNPGCWLESLGADCRQRLTDATRTCEQTGQYDEEYQILRPDSERRWIRDRAFAVRDDDHKIVQIVGVAEDITSRKVADIALRVHEEKLRQSQKMEAVGQLAGGIAHDFNNLLAAIGGNCELIAMFGPDTQTKECVDEIGKAVARAKRLVSQILTFSRTTLPQRQVTEVEPLVDEVLALLRATIPAGIGITKVAAADTYAVMADPSQLHQVVLNLCTNAWHAVADLGTSGTIEVRLANANLQARDATGVGRLPAGLYTALTVIDNGVGISKPDLLRIFEPFFTTKRIDQGTGLGLSVVHGIVVAHGGDVIVNSAPAEGTTVTVYLPAVTSTAMIEPKMLVSVPRGNGQRILFVDDEESLVLLATRLLSRLGYQVVCFTRPDDAIRSFMEGPDTFDLVVTDMNMPGLSGLDIAREVRLLRPNAPIVITSGFVTEDMRASAKLIGVNEVFYKPGSIDEFATMIDSFARGITSTIVEN